jgi:N-acetylmuramoyl-L-alanine amidase
MLTLTRRPSPNFNARQHPLDMLVLHYTGMESAQAALDRLCDPTAEVSAHYVVLEDGGVVALVDEDQRAWHAGRSTWQGDTDLNSRSIGIEIVNGGHDVPLPDGTLPPYPEAQIAGLIALCTDILARHPIPATRIVGHSDIAPARKTDPGEHFPWERLALAGVGLWPPFRETPPTADLSPEGVAALQADLRAIGYGLEVSGTLDNATALTLRAFQRRFLPDTLSGEPDARTRARVAQVRAVWTASAQGC